MRLHRCLLGTILFLSVSCSDDSQQPAAAPPAPPPSPSAGPQAAAEAEAPGEARRSFVVRFLSREEAGEAEGSTAERRERLKQSAGFADVVLMQPDEAGELALVEMSVWGSQADATRAAESMSGKVATYEANLKGGSSGPPMFGVPLGMLLFETPNVSEARFRAEVEVFAAISGKSPQYQGLLPKNVDPGGKVPFIYLSQWGSEGARDEILKSREFEALIELARLQKTEIMRYVPLHRVD